MSENRPFENKKVVTEAAFRADTDRMRIKLASLSDEALTQPESICGDSQRSESSEEGDELDVEDLLPLYLAEKVFIDQITAEVRKRMVSAEPETLRKIAAFLFALERLPYTTPDVSLDLAIMQRVEENLSYVSIELDGESVRLSTGGHVYSPDVGGDSYSETPVEVQLGGFRLGSTEDFSDWLDSFVSASGTIEVEGDADADLTERGQEDGWERLANFYGENSDG